MSKPARLRASDLRAVFHLVGECRDLGDDPMLWREHAFAQLAGLTGSGLVLGGEKGGLTPGAGVTLGTAAWGFQHGFDPAGWDRAVELFREDPDYSPAETRYVARLQAGDAGAAARSDVVDDRDWYRSADYNEVCRTIGIDHLAWCYLPTGTGRADEYSAVLLCRAVGDRDFTAREKAVFHAAHAALAPLVGGPLASFADPSPAALPPRVRRVLRCLLDGDSDKQAAARLGIGAHTVNQHAKAVYRHFGVSSRAELLARWIRRGWGGRFAWADDD